MKSLRINFLLSTLLLLLANPLLSQRVKLPGVSSKKAGPYFGFQKGKYNTFEFGGEFQYKKIKLVHPRVHGFRFGTNYDFQENVLGFDAAYWQQRARLGLTYGAILSHRTDFDESRIGISPALGFRLFQFHLQTGYTFYTAATDFENFNRFWIALKFTLVNKRDIDVKK